MKFNKKIAITTGDVNGIGAEITLKALMRLDIPPENVVLVSNSELIKIQSRRLGLPAQQYSIEQINFDIKDLNQGEITAQSGEFSFQCLKKACELAKNGEIDAIVTAPVSKEALHLAGHNFNGQTEVLQHFLAHDGQKAEMLFVAKDFRVLLLTRHVPLKDIVLNKDEIIDKVLRLNDVMKAKFDVATPNFALCGFNPHSGENGILGSEEKEILIPAAEELRAKGINITNPMPADTLFIDVAKKYFKSQAQTYDCFIAMYHDQGLIPIKTVASEKTVNMTIGLDVIRTSPCHGTAFDIAGKNIADESSMVEAILQVLKI